jgi:hypothetical protein
MEQYIPIKFEGTRDAALRVIEKIPLPFEVEIKPYKSKRSASQNRLYWKWLSEIAAQMEVDGKRFTKEEWHHLCGMKWIGVKTIELADKVFTMPEKSTTKLKVGEFAEYLTKIEAHFLEKGVALTFTDDYEEAMGK